MTGKRVLMVEGPDDEHAVKNICGQRQLGIIENIHPYGGKDPLMDGIGVRLKESDIGVLGIILDADTDLHARWQTVSSRLSQAGYRGVPAAPAHDGTIIEAPTDSLLPKVGIWLMPDNQVPGILEDFLRFLVPPGDGLLAHVDLSIDSIQPEQRKFTDMKKSKARIHTWLAWQDPPGNPLGRALTMRIFNPDSNSAAPFIAWFKKLYRL